MQQRQRAADQRIPQSSQPAGAVVPELIHVHANDFDEHQFRKSVENTLTAGPRIRGCDVCGDRAFDPYADGSGRLPPERAKSALRAAESSSSVGATMDQLPNQLQ